MRRSRAEANRARTRHGATINAGSTPEYRSWRAMKARCSPMAKPQDLVAYYQRGIRVCERWWASFEAFIADMGPRPPGSQIERIDNDGNYEPANCRWANVQTQARNRRSTVFVEWRGQRRSVAEWAEIVGIERHTLGHRLRQGWTVERAFTMKPDRANRGRKQWEQ